MSDGRVNKCKECNKQDVRNNRSAKIDYYREYDKARANAPNRVMARDNYSQTPKGAAAHRRAKEKWLENNVIKRAAHILVRNYVRSGRLERPEKCSSCGICSTRIHGHHNDYSSPLDVTWLCSKCHTTWHKLNGEGSFGGGDSSSMANSKVPV